MLFRRMLRAAMLESNLILATLVHALTGFH